MRGLILSGAVPSGVQVRLLQGHADERGDLHEMSRENWAGAFPVAQWNAMRSKAGTLRGMAIHLRITEFYLNAKGNALLGLADLRPVAAGARMACVIALNGEQPAAVTIPAGIAHGIYFLTDSVTLGALSAPHDTEDKVGCLWNDPSLGVPWPKISPRLIERDRRWPQAQAVRELIARHAAVPS